MNEYLTTWLHLATNRRAVTAIEYGLIAALVAVVIITAITGVGDSLGNIFDKIENAVNNATG